MSSYSNININENEMKTTINTVLSDMYNNMLKYSCHYQSKKDMISPAVNHI